MIRSLLAVLRLTAPRPAATLPPAFVPPPILMFHRVDTDRPRDAVGPALTVTPQALQSELRYLQPLLRRFGDSATFYITTGEVDQANHLTWGELRAMARSSVR